MMSKEVFFKRLFIRDGNVQEVELSEPDQKFIKASREVEKKWKEGGCKQGYQPYHDACMEMLAVTGKR